MKDKLITNPVSEDGEIHPLDYLILLAKYSRMIIYSSVAVTLLTYVILFCLPNKYTATARMLIPQHNSTLSAQILDNLGGSGPGVGGSSLGSMAANLLGMKSPTDLYVGLLGSDTISDNIIKSFNLRELYDQKYIEKVRKALNKRAQISAGKKDEIISIEVTDEDPKRAAAMANAYVEELNKFLKNQISKEATERLAFLEKERTKASLNLAKAEDALRSFSEKTSVLQIDSQTKGVIEYIATLRAAIDAKEVQLKVMRQKATPYNYDVIGLQTELQGLKDKLRDTEAKGSPDSLCQGDIMISTSKVPDLGLKYLRLYREAKFETGLYELYCKLVELARLDQLGDFSVVRVVDWAKPPEMKSSKRFLPSLAAGIMTFILMVFVAFGREYWQNAVRSGNDSQRMILLAHYLQPWSHMWQRFVALVLRRKNP